MAIKVECDSCGTQAPVPAVFRASAPPDWASVEIRDSSGLKECNACPDCIALVRAVLNISPPTGAPRAVLHLGRPRPSDHHERQPS